MTPTDPCWCRSQRSTPLSLQVIQQVGRRVLNSTRKLHNNNENTQQLFLNSIKNPRTLFWLTKSTQNWVKPKGSILAFSNFFFHSVNQPTLWNQRKIIQTEINTRTYKYKIERRAETITTRLARSERETDAFDGEAKRKLLQLPPFPLSTGL